MRRALVTGATGYLGGRVAARAVAAGWSVVGTYFARPSELAREWLDIRDAPAVRRLLDRLAPGRE